MKLVNLSVFGLLRERMDWLNERQKVLAKNVANADTPDFRAMDLAQPSFAELMRNAGGGAGGDGDERLAMKQTHGAHIRPGSGGIGGSAVFGGVEEAKYEVSPTGNTVVLEEEMMKVAETSAQYEIVSTLYSRGMKMMRLAIGAPNR